MRWVPASYTINKIGFWTQAAFGTNLLDTHCIIEHVIACAEGGVSSLADLIQYC